MRLARFTRAAAVVAIGLLAVVPCAPTFAAHAVDPSTLDPSPFDISPPGALIQCQATGQGTTCNGTAPVNYSFPDGLFCNGVELVETATGSGTLTMWYDQTGSITGINNHWDKGGPGTTLSDPATGQAVPFSAHYTFSVTFPTPADFGTAIRTTNGQLYNVTLPGGGLILHDVGTRMLGPDGLMFEGGPGDVLAARSGDGVIPALCTALGA
jgi:hypothetical protein